MNKQEVPPPSPPQTIANLVEPQPATRLTFPSPCWEDTQESNQVKQEEYPNRKEIPYNLMSWAAKFGFIKIPLLVKPTEEVKVEEQVMAKADFIAVENQEDQSSSYSECSVHVGTLLEEDVDPIEVTKSAMEEEIKSGQSPIGKEKVDVAIKDEELQKEEE